MELHFTWGLLKEFKEETEILVHFLERKLWKWVYETHYMKLYESGFSVQLLFILLHFHLTIWLD